MEKALKIVPVDTGYLQSTGKTTKYGSGFKTLAKVKFTAPYSMRVHERLDLVHGKAFNIKYADDIAAGKTHARKPEEQAKFIETPLRVYRLQIIRMIKDRMRERGREAKATTKSYKRKK